MTLLSAFGIIISSLVIYYAGEHFATASSFIGDYLGMSRSTKGATIDAISSSIPELLIVLFSLLLFFQFEVGLGTIVGSALFNVLVIPALSAFVAPKTFKISESVIHRDGLFYVLTVIIFMTAVFYSAEWSLLIGIVFVATYMIYFFEVFRHGSPKTYKERLLEFLKEGPVYRHMTKVRKKQKKLHHEITILLVSLVFITIFSYLLVKYSIEFAAAVGVPVILIAFVITAAATSMPDLVVSVVNAKRGDLDSATSNVFGSNIFDILIGLGIPILIATALGITLKISTVSITILFGLLASTVVTLYILAEDMKLTRPRAVILLMLYVILVGTVVTMS